MTAQPIHITDFTSHPQPRFSFSSGPIKDVIARHYQHDKEKSVNIVETIKKYERNLATITFERVNGLDPFWNRVWLSYLDGAMLYTTVASRNPRYYIEIGSGHSTKFVAKAIVIIP